MSKIDEIMAAALTLGDQRLMATHNRATRDDVQEAETDLRELIAAALADARREGEAEAQQRMYPCCGGNDESPAEHAMDCNATPEGQRQAVLLTDESQDDDDPWLSGDDLMGSSG